MSRAARYAMVGSVAFLGHWVHVLYDGIKSGNDLHVIVAFALIAYNVVIAIALAEGGR